MITRKELCRFLDELYMPHLFSDYGPNGLQVEGCEEIDTIGLAVTVTQETIEKAISHKCQALIVHHGIFWNKDPYPIIGTKKTKLSLLLENKISLFAYHLPMDAHVSIGNNWKAAIDLGLTNLSPFGMFEKSFIGVKGNLKPIPRKDFQKILEDYYQHQAHVAFGGKECIESVALVSGGAYKLLPDAAESFVDAFITGSYDLPAWSQSFEEKINFYALGHHATERIGPLALMEKLKSLLGITCHFIEEENPF